MMVTRRGDNIPSVKDYAHWNEDAERIWYEENKYDMEHADEIISYDDDNFIPDDYEFPNEKNFDTEAEAVAFFRTLEANNSTMGIFLGKWRVEWD